MSSSGTDYLYSIGAGSVAATSLIGSKARTLQQMAAHGLPVPPGFVLSTPFFEPWFELIERSASWAAWRAGQRAPWPALCATLQAEAANLPFSDTQLQILAELSASLVQHGPMPRYAVRSSSPDEDTENASFAGLYETCLATAHSPSCHFNLTFSRTP